jgi:hypothetical protein
MRLHRAVPAFAVAITLAGGAAPAYAFDNRGSELGPANVVSHTSGGGSSDSVIDIAAAAMAGAVIGAGGVAAAGRRSGAARRPARVATGRS